ncbi:MAG: glycerophosphodiester phosphodiesterase family protein [Pseudomonadota bacterium]
MPIVIGHRGAAAKAPENTFAGMRRAKTDGASWVEFDVKLTADDIPILMHDDHLDRTTDTKGVVTEKNAQDLDGVSAGRWFSQEFSEEPVPHLGDTLVSLINIGLGANIEIKPCPGRDQQTAEITLEYVNKYWPRSTALPLVSSFSEEALIAAARSTCPAPRGLLMTELTADWRERIGRLGCSTLHLDHRILDDDMIDGLLHYPWPLIVYTVNDLARARHLLERGIRAIITDDPGKLIDSLGI